MLNIGRQEKYCILIDFCIILLKNSLCRVFIIGLHNKQTNNKHTLDSCLLKCLFLHIFVVVQSLSHTQLFATLRTAARQASESFTTFQSLLKLMSVESVMPSNHSSSASPSPSTFNLSQHQGLFQWVSSSHQYSSVQLLSCVCLFATPWTAACQASLSIAIPRVHPNSCPLSRWCHPTISSSVIPFSSCSQSFPGSGSFQMSQFFTSGSQSTGVSASASVLPMNIQDWFPLGWTGWVSLLSKGLKSLLQHHSSKASILRCSAFLIVQLSHPYKTSGKTIALARWTFVRKVTSLLFNMLSRLVITFLPKSKRLSISWLQSPTAVILEPQKVKFVTVSPSICHEVMGLDAMILVFWMLTFKPTFSLSSFIFMNSLFTSSSLSAIRVVSSAYLRLLIFFPAILISASASSSPAFFMMYSAYKLNKQGDNIQPWHTPFPILYQSVPCPVLTVASWPAYIFLRRQVR